MEGSKFSEGSALSTLPESDGSLGSEFPAWVRVHCSEFLEASRSLDLRPPRLPEATEANMANISQRAG